MCISYNICIVYGECRYKIQGKVAACSLCYIQAHGPYRAVPSDWEESRHCVDLWMESENMEAVEAAPCTTLDF